MTRVNPDYSADLLSAIWKVDSQQQTALLQLASGKRVNQPSDDPAAASEMVQSLAVSADTDQYRQNISSVTSLLNTADSALSSVVTEVNQAITLGTEAATSTVSAAQREQLAQSVQGVLNNVLQLANTSFHGSYIFAGTAADTPPFVPVPATATSPASINYVGNAGPTAVNSVEVAAGNSVPINIPGSDLFQSSSGDILGSLQNIVTALQNNSPTDVGTATTALTSALQYLSARREFYGSTVSQLSSTDSYLQQEQVTLTSDQTNLVGIDVAQASMNVSQAQLAENSALAAAGKVLQTSLLSYLPPT